MIFRRSLARIRYIWRALPPPPPTQKLATLLPIPTRVITFFSLSACSAGKCGPFYGEVFYFNFLEWGGLVNYKF